MSHPKIKIICLFFLLTTIGGYAQQTCYQIGINESRELYNEAQRLERSGRCVEAVPRFWEALRRFRLTRSCRDLPANHELDLWEDRCIQGMAACGGKSDASTFLIASPGTLSFSENGGDRQITVNTNTTTWRVDRFPSWCTTQKVNNRLTVTCKENTETNSRSDKLLIVANTLTFEIAIEQAGKTIVETPDFERIKITAIQFAGKYSDDRLSGYGEDLYNDMAFLLPRITYDHLSNEAKKIQLDFKIAGPNGQLLTFSNSGYSYSDEISLRGNLYQHDVIDCSEWGSTNGAMFFTTGVYTFEIWCSETNLFSAFFEVLPKPFAQDERFVISEVPASTPELDSGSPTPTSPISPPESPVSPIKLGIGLKAGLNLANISNHMGNINFSPEMKPDFHAGIFLNLNFGYRNQKPGFFGLQPEVLYSRQGFAVKSKIVNFDYVTVPLMVKLYLHEGFNLELGPWVSYLLAVNPNSIVFDGKKIKLSDLKGGKDVGFAAGIGFDSNFGLTVGARYLHGFSDLANNVFWMNQVIAVSIGWKF